MINLEGVELTVAQRSIDFVGGATYAINGSLQAVSNNIFIAAPDSIEVSGDLKSEIMNENTISPTVKIKDHEGRRVIKETSDGIM